MRKKESKSSRLTFGCFFGFVKEVFVVFFLFLCGNSTRILVMDGGNRFKHSSWQTLAIHCAFPNNTAK